MTEVYRETEANPLAIVNPFEDIASRLRIDARTMSGDLVYLADSGLVKRRGTAQNGSYVSITASGINFVESYGFLTKDD